ncbi:uncharacterized protein Cen isoform X2 [Lepeophtheirus salmonis]|uniref:uncharacterized protein Cen isoform X2 n=1 Tax=Lepeophtheirus salmonis TaxID=72036 RepID=UPI001AE7C217|nr:serine-rich adhesin for platelets-like isoform X2 [Lepeophtheirus salmonis]
MSLWKSAAHHASSLHGNWSTNVALSNNGVHISSNEKFNGEYRSASLEDDGLTAMGCSATAATTPASPYSTPPLTPRLLLKRSNLLESTSSPPVSLLQKGVGGESNLNSLEAWDYSVELEYLRGGGTDDLQLAAELGKTLLERNKELENVVKQHQSLVEDQSHEIEYLTKQNLVLREVNESRLKVYEQLEVSINDLEDSNRKLVEESKSDKSRIKSLVLANNRLESRMEELQGSMEESSSRNRVITTTSTSSRSKRRERRRCSKSDTDTGSSSSSIQSSSSDDKFLECNDSLILNKDECSSNEVEEDIGSKEVLSEDDEETSLTKDTSSETSSRIGSNSPASSGYSSEQPYRFSISSSDNFENKSCLPLSIPNKDESSSTSGNSESDSPFMVSQQKISELQKAFTHLNSENALLKEEIEKTKQQQEDADTVQEEVLKIKDVKIGKLCRRCLGNIENPLAQGLNAVQQIVQQVQSDFVHEKNSTTLAELEKNKEGEMKSGCGSIESLSESLIPHFPAPHKYSPPIHRNALPFISLQDELMMSSVSKGDVESGYTSLCGSRKDSSSSISSSITSFIRRKESNGSSTLFRRDSLLSRKDSMQSTWSSPEYDLILSEVRGGDTTATWSGPTSILLPEYTIPEEKCEELHLSRMSSSEDNCSSGFFESIPYKDNLLLSTPRSFSKSSQNEMYLQNSLHQNYKDIFKEIFTILRKAQY